MLPERIPYRALGWLAALTTFGIVYGSLLPFEYRSLPLDVAIERFRHLSWINVGEGGRADLVANLVLYLPFGFFTCAVLSRRTLLGGALLTILLGGTLAVSVEFAQFWADPRTVSLDDIITEISGTVIGAVVWALWGKSLAQATQATIEGGRQAMQAAFGLYILAYTLFSLFPFDFLVSVREIAARLDEPNVIVWTSHDFFSLRGFLGLLVRIAAMIPLGAVAKLAWRRSIVTAIVVAAYFAAVIELLHWFEVSYSLSFANIVIAGLGAALGHRFADSLAAGGLGLRVTSWLQSGTRLLALVYVLTLTVARGWSLNLAPRSQIEQTFAQMNWWPFYYHYYVPEGAAVASTVTVVASFMPVGMLRWAMQLGTGYTAAQSNPVWPSAVAAALLCAVLEIGALLTSNLRPDPTNVLIAVVAAMLGQRACEWAARIAQEMVRPGSRVR